MRARTVGIVADIVVADIVVADTVVVVAAAVAVTSTAQACVDKQPSVTATFAVGLR